MDRLEDILPSKLYEVLERNGLNSCKQILIFSVWDIKKITNLSNEDILMLKNIVSNDLIPNCSTCEILLRQENEKVKTGCKVIDATLRGGFRRGTITEIYGESGSGKTQIGIQTAVYNWNNGCVYICTEDLFPVKRYEQIKENLPNYCPTINYGNKTYIEHVTETHDLLSCIRIRLPQLVLKKKVSLIVIDSVAAPFRVENTNYIRRADELRELAILLIKIAKEHNLAVICINQVTAAFNESVDVIPSLGLAWSNMITTRLWLKKTNQTYNITESFLDNPRMDPNEVFIRELSVEFAPDLPYSSAKCIITSGGIRGI